MQYYYKLNDFKKALAYYNILLSTTRCLPFAYDIQRLFDQLFNGRLAVAGKLFGDAVGNNSADRQAMMPQQFSQSVDTGCFHFKIGDAVRTERKLGKAVDQLRVAEPEAQDPALGTIKSRAGNRNTMVEVIDEMFYKMGAAATDIRL